jgi:hypothetical protein
LIKVSFQQVLHWLSSVAGSVAVLGTIGFFCRHVIVDWISRSIQHTYDIRLETIRAASERELHQLRSVLDSQQTLVSSAFLEARRASNDRRLNAIQLTWDAMMGIFFEAPSVVAMTNLIPTELYHEFFTSMRSSIPDVLTTASQYGTPQNTTVLSVEKARLLTGEYLYSLFWAYRAFTGSIALNLAISRDKGNFVPWWHNDHILGLLKTILTTEEFEEFNALPTGKYVWVTQILERQFLSAAEDIVDGKRAANEAFAQARNILAAANAVSESMKQGA